MRKIRPEKIAGIVALSYLVLIPAGAFVAWRKIQFMDEDIAQLWEAANIPAPEPKPIFSLNQLKSVFGR